MSRAEISFVTGGAGKSVFNISGFTVSGDRDYV